MDHLGIFAPTSLIEQEVKFFDAAMKPLGMGEQFRVMPTVIAMGTKEKAWLWISNYNPMREEIKDTEGLQCIHLAFEAKTRKQVDEFYEAAIKAGGKDHGAPGIRKDYHDNYYGAFVISPTGHNVEAVIHGPDA